MRRGLWGLCAVGLLFGCHPSGEQAAAKAKAAAPDPLVLTAERDRAVDFVYVKEEGPGKASGGTMPAKVLVKPNPSHEVRVAVYEEYSGGAGAQWRASVWMASFLSSFTLGRPLSDYEFGVSAGGFVDGPSAGALTTAAMIAALENVPVRKEVTMTGTINPDGTVGPVGGIPQKLRGAAAKGKKLFGYPTGQRYDEDLATGELADLQGLAEENHLQAKEIHDLYDAYQLLTGHTLPRPTPVSADEMELPPKVFQRVQAKTSAWLSRAQASADLAAESARPALLQTKLLDEAKQQFQTAARYQKQGLASAGFASAMEAAAYAELVQHMNKLVDFVGQGSFEKAALELHAQAAVRSQADAFGELLATEEPTTANETMGLVEALHAYATAEASIAIADERAKDFDALLRMLRAGRVPDELKPLLRLPKATANKMLELVVVGKAIYPSLFYSVAGDLIDGGRDLLEAKSAGGAPLKLDAKEVTALARSYTSAAKANLDYFDSIVLAEQARASGRSLAATRAKREDDDFDYQMAEALAAEAIGDREKTDLSHALRNLAAAQQSYLFAAKLVTRDYSLGAHKNKQGELVVEHDKALMSMLDLAEGKAREQAGEAKKVTGVVPVMAQMDFQQARAEREGTPEQKLNALADYWSASQASQLAVMLTRLSAKPAPAPVASGETL